MQEKLYKNEWDYTEQAKYYYLRPNYAPGAIERLCNYVKAKPTPDYLVADIGAGTGNLTELLLNEGLNIIAIEPNPAMRAIGQARIKEQKVHWRVGSGENTFLEPQSVALAVFGSSFNTTERTVALRESHRILKEGGYFACMWNQRLIETAPLQKQVEQIIRKFIPTYTYGSRREDQSEIILGSKLFTDLHYIEEAQLIRLNREKYLDAWKSVRNKYWDLSTTAGKELLDKILSSIRDNVEINSEFEITYQTKIWIAQKI